ncbi:MAG: ribosomal-processing cysteine protease Prp [Oscillospiraceae bacterium]|nr:ribosomal-processing cysteine protease Prp [Oscillospiraceae bacterium]
MITARFYKSKAGFEGFELTGHSGLAEAGSDVCCAAVSSAAELICNALTDFMECSAEAEVIDTGVTDGDGENVLKCSLTKGSGEAYRLMNAFYAHLKLLQEDYPQNIKVIVK